MQGTCPTLGTVQLLPAHRVAVTSEEAYDEDGNAVRCPFCGAPVFVSSLARDEAQFAIGQVEVSERARDALARARRGTDLFDWAEPAAKLIMQHVEARDTDMLDGGGMMSTHVVARERLVIYTYPNRTKTIIRQWSPEDDVT